MPMPEQVRRVSRLLLRHRGQGHLTWPWLNDGRDGSLPIDKQRANKFFAGAIIDYQMPADAAWERARERTEDDLGDPPDLWRVITSCRLSGWNARWKHRPWHRFPKGHERVWTIGRRVVDQYGGDVRNIWKGQNPVAALERLVKLGVGPQISRMIVGALIDTKQIRGRERCRATKPDCPGCYLRPVCTFSRRAGQ